MGTGTDWIRVLILTTIWAGGMLIWGYIRRWKTRPTKPSDHSA